MKPHVSKAQPVMLPAFSILFLLFCSACTSNAAPVPEAESVPLPAASATAPSPTATEAAAAPTQTAASPSPQPTASATPEPTQTPLPADVYLSQPGDTLGVVASHFGVSIEALECVDVLRPCPPASDSDPLLDPGTPLLVNAEGREFQRGERLLPDSEVVFSAAASDFDVDAFVSAAGGSLAVHRQYLMMNAWNSGAEIVSLVAHENSINPRLLLALLEYQCRCVLEEENSTEPFMGAEFYVRHDLYGQLIWAIHELSAGYYGWRAGTFTEVTLVDGTVVALDPTLNAGTVALYNLFSYLYDQDEFQQVLDPENGFAATFKTMFGDPWTREIPIYSRDIRQPDLDLPFEKGFVWSYTGGPHPAFEGNGPRAALDFAPASAEPGCQSTPAWVTAVADGLVVTSEYGMLVQDLDGDGNPQTGWTIIYLHVGEEERVPAGTHLKIGDRIGKPSCEGGTANGTHLHIARRLNGEWIPAGSGPMPFEMNGWVAQDEPDLYKGTLAREGKTLVACTCSWRLSWIEND